MNSSVEELERVFRRLAEEKESVETPKLLEQAINNLNKLSAQKHSGSVPVDLVNELHREDYEASILQTLHRMSLKREEGERKRNKLLFNF